MQCDESNLRQNLPAPYQDDAQYPRCDRKDSSRRQIEIDYPPYPRWHNPFA